MGEFRRVLVTGGAGFIGSQYVRYALRRHPDWEIALLDKLTYAGNAGNLRDVEEKVTFFHGDICEPRTVRKAVAGADAVVNFAAETHVDRSLIDARPFVRTNVEGTRVLLAEAVRAGAKRFLQVSTDEVYGDLSGTACHSRESDALPPRSPYAATKAAADRLVLGGASGGLEVVVTRGSNTYGPYQYPEKIIPLFITNALEDRPLPVYGDGGAVRDYLHVDDHCRGIDLVLHEGASPEVYNLGARLQIPGIDVAEHVLGLLGKPRDLIRFVADRPAHDYRYSVDPSKAEALGWMRRRDFADGLAETVAWYANNREWWQRTKRSREFREHHRRWYGTRLPASSQAEAP